MFLRHIHTFRAIAIACVVVLVLAVLWWASGQVVRDEADNV